MEPVLNRDFLFLNRSTLGHRALQMQEASLAEARARVKNAARDERYPGEGLEHSAVGVVESREPEMGELGILGGATLGVHGAESTPPDAESDFEVAEDSANGGEDWMDDADISF